MKWENSLEYVFRGRTFLALGQQVLNERQSSTHMNQSLPTVMSGNGRSPGPKPVKGREEQFFLVIRNLMAKSNHYTIENLNTSFYMKYKE